MQLIFGFLIALVLFWLMRYWLQSASNQGKQWGLSLALGIAALVFLLLALTGRLHFLAAAAAALFLFVRKLITLLRYGPLLKQIWSFLRPPVLEEGGISSVTTSLLRVWLDRERGQMDGEVLAGAYTGRRLSDLNEAQLLKLYRECRVRFPDTIPILEAYLDRVLEQSWRQRAEQEGMRPRGAEDMTRDEALAILGLQPGATEAEIVAAHRRMMQKVHPDRGGSHLLAAQVNRAKEILLGR